MNLGVKGDLKQEIFNEVNENVRALERLFPSVVKDGQVDFEALKEELGQFEEVGPEKYGLTWSGKQNAKKLAQQDIVGKTLKYIPEDSKNPETTENIYIEGDNLEVLKLLRQNYYGAIKMIYIDPPYNTGNDFVYNDNFKKSKYESDKEEGDISELGERYTINSKSSNKYHANWLNMMYPRLKVAKDLLTEDGIIFISIDDTEVNNLRSLCEEIFGVDNCLGCFARITKKAGKSTETIAKNNDYIIAFSKSKNSILYPFEHNDDGFKFVDEYESERGKYKLNQTLDYDTLGYVNSLDYPVKIDNDVYYAGNVTEEEYKIRKKSNPKDGFRWRWSKELFNFGYKNGFIVVKKYSNGTSRIYTKTYQNARINKDNNGKYSIEYIKRTKALSTLEFIDNCYSNDNSRKNIEEVFSRKIFEYSKPVELLYSLIKFATQKNDIVIDFFSGSGTLANSIIKLNANDKGNRRFIMVQLPEKTDIKSEAYKAGYKNICDIGKERIRRAGELIKEENKDKEGIEDLDIGFKVFRVGDTNIRWNYEKEDLKTLSNEVTIKSKEEQATFDFIAATKSQATLGETVSAKDRLDFMPGVKDIDIVYEILLRQRDIPLSAKVELLEDIGKRTYIFADSYLVCLEEDITAELIEKLAELNPLPIKFILRDSAFGDDIALKDEAYRRLKALIERNSGENKKSYTVEFI